MNERYRQALMNLMGKVGFLLGGGVGIALTTQVGGPIWWAARPLWFHLLPLVGCPLLGFALAYLGTRSLLHRLVPPPEPVTGKGPLDPRATRSDA